MEKPAWVSEFKCGDASWIELNIQIEVEVVISIA